MKGFAASQNLHRAETSPRGPEDGLVWPDGTIDSRELVPSVAMMKRIASLRAKILRGEYRISAEALVEKMLPVLMGRKKDPPEFTES